MFFRPNACYLCVLINSQSVLVMCHPICRHSLGIILPHMLHGAGIFTSICSTKSPICVGTYTSTMEHMGICLSICLSFHLVYIHYITYVYNRLFWVYILYISVYTISFHLSWITRTYMYSIEHNHVKYWNPIYPLKIKKRTSWNLTMYSIPSIYLSSWVILYRWYFRPHDRTPWDRGPGTPRGGWLFPNSRPSKACAQRRVAA